MKELSPKGLLENLGHGRLTESAPVVPLLGGGETAIGEVAPDRPPLVGVLRGSADSGTAFLVFDVSSLRSVGATPTTVQSTKLNLERQLLCGHRCEGPPPRRRKKK